MTISKIKTIDIVDFNRIEDHVFWLNANRVRKHDFRTFPAKAVMLDFSNSRFLKPYHIAPLACLIHEYQDKGFAVKLLNVSVEIRSYLMSFEFDEFCYTQKNINLTVPSDKKNISLMAYRKGQKRFLYHDGAKLFREQSFLRSGFIRIR